MMGVYRTAEVVFWLAAGLIVYAYAIYPLILYIRSRCMSAERAQDTDSEYVPVASMLVSAYNEEKVIGEKIRNLIELNYPSAKKEIVIVSDGSDDRTDDIVKSYASMGVKLVAPGRRSGKVNALNMVMPSLKGEIIILSDANTIFERDAVKTLLKRFRDPVVGCVCGELIYRKAGESEVINLEGFYWRYEQFMKKIEGDSGTLLGANGGIYAIRKGLFERLPSNTIIDDFLIPMKILEKGYKVVYEPGAVAYEETADKIVQEMERRIRIGAGDFQALFMTWRMLDPRRGFPAFAYFSHKVLRWFVPFLMVVAFTANAFLLWSGFYFTIFCAQCVFYTAALAGRIVSRMHVRLKMLGLPYYFVSMNLALFFGFFRFCANSQSAAWKRTDR